MAVNVGSGARRRRAQAAVVLAVALAAAGVVGTPSPVSACSLVQGPPSTPEEHLARTDLVFEGLAVASRVEQIGASSFDHTVWTFVVDRAVKGSPGLQQEVAGTARPRPGAGGCDFTFQVGVRYRVYAFAQGDGYTTSLGSGTTRLGEEPFDRGDRRELQGPAVPFLFDPAWATPSRLPADVAGIAAGVLDRTG